MDFRWAKKVQWINEKFPFSSLFVDENSGVSEDVQKSLKNVKRVKVNPPKRGHTYPALSDIESSGPNTPQQYTPEPAEYTDDDNEQPIIERYLYNSKDNENDDDDR